MAQNKFLQEKDWGEIIKLLKANYPGINFDLKNRSGLTPLSLLSRQGMLHPIKVFLKKSEANIYALDFHGRTAFQIASANNRLDVASYLYDLSHRDNKKMNPSNYLNSYVMKDFRYITFLPSSAFSVYNKVFRSIESFIINEHGAENGKVQIVKMRSHIQDEVGFIDKEEKFRKKVLNDIILNGSLSKSFLARKMSEVILAIESGNIEYLKRNLKTITGETGNSHSSYFNVILTRREEPKEQTIPLTHLFLEAIRSNYLEVVKLISEQTDVFQLTEDIKGYKTYFMDPLTVALLVSKTLDINDDKSIKENLEIINYLLDHDRFPIDEAGIFGLRPIELASILGLYDVVKRLHEEKKVNLPDGSILIRKVDLNISYLQLALSQEYFKLAQYYQKIAKEKQEFASTLKQGSSKELTKHTDMIFDCKEIFLN